VDARKLIVFAKLDLLRAVGKVCDNGGRSFKQILRFGHMHFIDVSINRTNNNDRNVKLQQI